MPDPSEFGLPENDPFMGDGTTSGVGKPPILPDGRPDLNALRARARQLAQARAAGQPVPPMTPPPLGGGAPAPVMQAAAPAAEPDFDDDAETLAKVEEKLQLATYYRSLRENPVFGDATQTDIFAAAVQIELNEWVTRRMKELVGIAQPEVDGLSKDDIALLRTLARDLGPNGVKALVALAQKVLSPTPAVAQTQAAPPPVHRVPVPPPAAPEASPEPEEEAPPPAPAQPSAPVVRAPPKPRVRRAPIPGAPPAPAAPPVEQPAPAKPRRKRSADPLAAGRAAVAAATQPPVAATPTAPTQATQPAHDGGPKPIPMPTGFAMSAAMEGKAHEALGNRNIVIETTGGGVL